MDPDLNDLLSAWMGGESEPARAEALLERLRRDEVFRLAFVEEIRILGMIRAVNSAEPRWLRLEDELGWSAFERPAGETLDPDLGRELSAPAGPSRRLRWGVIGLAAAAVLLLATVGILFGTRKPPPNPAPPSTPARSMSRIDAASRFAMVLKLEAVRWEPGQRITPSEGEVLPPCRLRLRSGRVTLSMLTGVVLVLEGPSDVELVSNDRISCRRGRLRAHVPEGAEGFLVSGPGSAVMDLGTDFGLNIKPDGKSRGKVFKGEVEAAVFGGEGNLRSSQFLDATSHAFEIDPDRGNIDTFTHAEDFLSPPDLVVPSLVLDPSYPNAIMESRPWAYWRFESLAGGLVPNEVAGQPPLRATGPVHLTAASRNRSAEFSTGQNQQYLELEGFWEPPRLPGYAVELWFVASSISQATLCGLVSPPDTENHLAIVELTSRNRLTMCPPASVRFLHRWPTSRGGGDNGFSSAFYVPYRWHHLVSQVNGATMEIYLDGTLVSSVPVDREAKTTACQVLLGRLTTMTQSSHHHSGFRRAFAGRLDEVALYNQPLPAATIAAHSRLGKPLRNSD